MQDFLGKEIEVGDTVVYPGRQGSSLWMRKAEVLVVGAKSLGVAVEQRNYSGVTGTREVVITNVRNVTVVAKAH